VRIAYLLADTGVSGGVKVVFQQARALRRRGHDVVVGVPGEPPDWLDVRDVPVVRVPGLAPERVPDADVVVATYFTTVAAAHLSGRGLPVHLCQGYEGGFAHLGEQRSDVEAAYRLPLPLLALHGGLAALAEERFGKRTAVFGQGLDPGEFVPDGRTAERDGPARVLVPGPIGAVHKGVADALAAAVRVRERGTPLEVVRVSQLPFGDDEPSLDLVAERHAQVPAREMPALYRSCDVILAPCTSADDGGLPVLEAIACGTPAVVTDVPSFRTYARERDWAAFAPEGNVEAIAAALERVLRDAGERERLRERGLEIAATHRMEDVAERIESALEAWLRGGARPNGKHALPTPTPTPAPAPARPSVVLSQRESVGQPEWAWAQRTARRSAVAELGAEAVRVARGEDELTVGALLAATAGDAVGVLLDDTAVLPPGTWSALTAALAADDSVDVVVPLANESASPEGREPPPHVYRTPSMLEAVADARRREHGAATVRAAAVDPFAYVARRAALESLAADLPASAAPAELTAAVALGTYAHRWAPVLAQPRLDLLAEVPSSARDVLDVGCATGAFGAALKARRDCRVVGLEADPELAAAAEASVDRVVHADLESLPADAFGREFDCVVCGDVLEHLRDPWAALEKLTGWLRPSGTLVATVPNIGHWAVVRDLARGRFDYVPFGLLCWSHLRFFSRTELEALVTESGLAVERIDGYGEPPTPEAGELVAALRAADPQCDADSLATHEFLVVARAPDALVPHPFLHDEGARVRHPLLDRSLAEGDDGYAELRARLDGRASTPPEPLVRDGWLVDADHDPSREFRLRIVSLELHSVCNDACWFCPVSVAPRDREFMPDALVGSVLDQLAAHRDTIEAVFMNNYNEPTVDPRFVDHVTALTERGLPVALLTNGSGLTPRRADALVALGGLRHLGVNISSADGERYRAQRSSDHLRVVLRNLDHAATLDLAPSMQLIVLGEGDARHDREHEEIQARFAGTKFAVIRHIVKDRAGYAGFSFGAKPERPHESLCGCDHLGSRPLEHVHITASGRCVLCCEDYDEDYVVGDLREQSLDEILGGDALARLRRRVYGLDEAPPDFICRSCVFARS
jgi:glycosyltransferase involved in cell wall biosynthesis/SAM-dependent methyltransferase/MoaA/NifB/PqqE/SkfB family radical SAM enzyme